MDHRIDCGLKRSLIIRLNRSFFRLGKPNAWLEFTDVALISGMTVKKSQRLNQLLRRLPPGMLVDSQWLKHQGISSSSVHDYVAGGWLERLQPRLYRRPTEPPQSSPIPWELAVTSAQLVTKTAFHVGGRTALDLLGLTHFLQMGSTRTAWLYDSQRGIPSWLEKLPLDADLVVVRRKLFAADEVGLEYRPLDTATRRVGLPVPRPSEEGLWRQFLRMSAAERATLELLAEIADEFSFQAADTIFEGLSNLRPAVLARVLEACTSVKVKRLFFFFAERHQHAWARGLDPGKFDLGRGKRQIVKRGRLDDRFQITVPTGMTRDSARDS
jgi:hypothetical protein